MRSRTRVVLWILGIGFGALLIVAGLAAVIVLRNAEAVPAAEREANIEFARVRAQFPQRPPLVELVDPRQGAIRINRPPAEAERRPVREFYILAWEAADQRLVRTRAPIWLMRLSLLKLGLTPGLSGGPWNLTAADVERYGPGLVLDFDQPGRGHVLVWVQ
jgi:hypothetical protein